VVLAAGAVIIVVGAVYIRLHGASTSPGEAAREARVGCSEVAAAFHAHQTQRWLVLRARVKQILPDEYGTYQHQRFIVQCASGMTVLVTNDVSIGTRVPVTVGPTVGVRGEYIWNDQGGLVHFTHHGGSNGGGWILYRGRLYSLAPANHAVPGWARG
jgi:hypothetical protein